MFERRERFVTATERRKMRELREQRMAIGKIARTVGRPKTTVWDHVRDIVQPEQTR